MKITTKPAAISSKISICISLRYLVAILGGNAAQGKPGSRIAGVLLPSLR